MPGDCISPTSDKISIEQKRDRKGEIFELRNFDYKEVSPSDNDKYASRNPDPQSSEISSTKELISAISHVWSRAREPLSSLLSRSNSASKTRVIQEDGKLHYTVDIFSKSTSAKVQPYAGYFTGSVDLAKLDQGGIEYAKNNNNISSHRPSYESFSFWKIVHSRSLAKNFLSNQGVPPKLFSNYAWMNKVYPAKLQNQKKCNGIEDSSGIPTHIPEAVIPIFPESEILCPIIVQARDCETGINETENELGHCKVDGRMSFVKEESFEAETCLAARQEAYHAFAKCEHAFAGAMAGIFVSLCLHPMDTIKTVVQSYRGDQRPLSFIGRSIVSERGVAGLYRGISSNVITSAPISAVYTYTYESVKKTLLPLLPKEYHSFAHCTAGGCSSVATSFISTPSERIKQQMQIGSHYKNCWTALSEIVRKGGLPSLYNGWGAVLCRNVPHSVIKFYTYESLKEIILPSVQPNTLVTLVCGGLAGSTASLFTTPFDVVKTRLQTQIPGSTTQYDGVFNTLSKIGKNEGLKGLYRGLTPRLAMYMIQGSLFFASYESFKRLLNLEAPQLTQHPA